MDETANIANVVAVEFANSDPTVGTEARETRALQRRMMPLRQQAKNGQKLFVSGAHWALASALALGVACATIPRGASEANFVRARNEASEGAALFQQSCAGCHGERGESVSGAPRILGEGALPEYPRELNINSDPTSGDPEMARLKMRSRPAGAPRRDPFRSAQDLYGFVSRKMPPGKEAGPLSGGQFWAIVNFMLIAHGVQVPQGGVNEENASSVKLQVGRP